MTAVFAGKVAFVTGAASGIGRATALAFAAEGARLILLDVNAAALDEVRALADARAQAVAVDLGDTGAVDVAARAAIAEAGGVDILVNSAGIAPQPDGVLTVDPKQWVERLTINLIAPALLTRIAAEDMIRRGVPGRIVYLSSSSGFRAHSPACYASAKAALAALARAAAAELGPHDINVNAVAPGLTATPMTMGRGEAAMAEQARTGPLANLLGRVSLPEDVASAILYLCRPESRQITGQTIHTSAGTVV